MQSINKLYVVLGVLLCLVTITGGSLLRSRHSTDVLSKPLSIHGDKTIIKNSQPIEAGTLVQEDSIVLTYDLKGVCLLGGPSSLFSLISKNGTVYSVSLAHYGTNCAYGNQTLKIPIRDFAITEPLENIQTLETQFWYPSDYEITLQNISLGEPLFGFLSEGVDNLTAAARSSFTRPLRHTVSRRDSRNKVGSTVSTSTSNAPQGAQSSLPIALQPTPTPIPTTTTPSPTPLPVSQVQNTQPAPQGATVPVATTTPAPDPAPATTPVPAPEPAPAIVPVPAPATIAPQSASLWAIRSVSSMKETKDKICGQDSASFINSWISKASELGVNYIAVETPYDNPACGSAVAYTKAWVDAIHARGLNVWHRHAPLAFEGIYTTAKDSSKDYLAQIASYIKNNPTFFKAGDIFTPIPEPQNGGISGITYCPQNICIFLGASAFNSWLRNAITTSENAFATIGLGGKMKIGYFGFDGFVAWGDNNPDWHGILEDATIAAMGNITIDHYPEIVGETMSKSLDDLQAKYPNTPIVIGEWGTITTGDAVAQVNASMSAAQRPGVIGFDYWHMGMGGNESLINDDFSEKPAFAAVKAFFSK